MYKHPDIFRQDLEDWHAHLPGTFLLDEEHHEYVTCIDLSAQGSERGLALSDLRMVIESPTSGRTQVDGTHLRCVFPRLGMTDMMGDLSLYYLHYEAQRQFRKSLNERLIRTNCANVGYASELSEYRRRTSDGRAGGRGSMLLSINQVLKGEYPTLEEAVASLIEGEYSGRALSRNFGVIADFCYEHPAIIYRTLVIGSVIGGVANIHPTYTPMVEEFEEQTGQEAVINDH